MKDLSIAWWGYATDTCGERKSNHGEAVYANEYYNLK
jgi:hypothetical protein